ncbi:dynein light chain 2, cytoplasmic-like isoform X2 [Gigantopelta aegis]|uniref:dynein light chain 2, cytoplasmic-like isoform X2 n=2 Tax=Gigantopelta aegis TaxID=1735272 RepID=UPI001B88DF89|nr:dynein light chain 2, cytoplasmic-like isoform X2 [Gigantopelta aegis]
MRSLVFCYLHTWLPTLSQLLSVGSRIALLTFTTGWSRKLQDTNMTERKAVVKNADMNEDMQQEAVDCATQAMEKYNIEKDIAAFIKKEFDKKYNPTWHCVVGRNFGSYVTHETKHFIYFYLGQVAVLLFKSG